MRINCSGYVDDEFRDDSTITTLMAGIESFEIERPEFEIVSSAGGLLLVHVAAVFTVDGLQGWLTSYRDHESGENVFACQTSSGSEVIENAIVCGCPETISANAILDEQDVLAVIHFVMRTGKYTLGKMSLREAFNIVDL